MDAKQIPYYVIIILVASSYHIIIGRIRKKENIICSGVLGCTESCRHCVRLLPKAHHATVYELQQLSVFLHCGGRSFQYSYCVDIIIILAVAYGTTSYSYGQSDGNFRLFAPSQVIVRIAIY